MKTFELDIQAYQRLERNHHITISASGHYVTEYSPLVVYKIFLDIKTQNWVYSKQDGYNKIDGKRSFKKSYSFCRIRPKNFTLLHEFNKR